MHLKTKIGDLTVSTVSLLTGGYETMVFDDVTGKTDVRKDLSSRHATEEMAREWHYSAVGVLKAEIKSES